MSSNIITEREMLRRMAAGKPFSIAFVQYDAKRNKGGKITTISEAVLLQKDKEAKEQLGRPLSPAEEQAIRVQEEDELRKNPHHSRWYTRNLRVLQNGAPTAIVRKFHPPLVVAYNNKRVVV